MNTIMIVNSNTAYCPTTGKVCKGYEREQCGGLAGADTVCTDTPASRGCNRNKKQQ